MTLPLLMACTLPVGGDTATDSSSLGTLSDGSFRLDWQQSDAWSEGSCVELSLSNQGEDATDWRAGLALSEEVTAWTWLDDGLSPDGSSALTMLPTDDSALPRGEAVAARYCSQPAALPLSLSVWAITEEDTLPDELSGTIEDQTGQVWVSWADGGQRGGAECLELSVINISTHDIPIWRLELTLSEAVTLTETWNAVGLLEGTLLKLIPTSSTALAPSQQWSGWICLDPVAWPLAASLITDDTTDTGR